MNVQLRSQRGAIGRSWHAAALREMLEDALGPGRARDGKRLARAGAVQWIDIAAGTVRGAVEGIDGTAFQASLTAPPIRPDDRPAVQRIAAAHPDLPARLTAGEYPQEIEDELAGDEVPMLPPNAFALGHDCSCPDWPGPCQHVAALAFVLVEALDEEPLALWRWRGFELSDLVASEPVAHARRAIRSGSGEDLRSGEPDADGVAVQASAADADAAAGDDATATGRFVPSLMDLSALVPHLGDAAVRALTRFYGSVGLDAPDDDPDEPPAPAHELV